LLPASLAERVLASVCADCWSEWEKQEVMVINELRLNFMDPSAAAVLHQKLREFLALPEPGA
jgi:Fe-S cluster biosynthesis and repair protein YggX